MVTGILFQATANKRTELARKVKVIERVGKISHRRICGMDIPATLAEIGPLHAVAINESLYVGHL
jgi:hypothetical protein